MTAALAAQAAGLDTLVVEKSPQFGGSTALSGGGIWVPGCTVAAPCGLCARPRRRRSTTCKQITDGLVSDARLRQYVDAAPEMMEFLEKPSPWFEFVWKPGYADYYPELPGGSELGSTINVPAIDLRKLGDEEQHLLAPLALAPEGNLVRAQGSSAVLPGPAVLAGQGRAGEADLADVPGAGVR